LLDLDFERDGVEWLKDQLPGMRYIYRQQSPGGLARGSSIVLLFTWALSKLLWDLHLSTVNKQSDPLYCE